MSRRGSDLLVVKVGGSCLEELEPPWWDALVESARTAERPAKLVVVHGWSRMVSAATPDGQPDFIVDKHGFRSRYTTPEVLDRIVAVAAELRERIATALRERGLAVDAVDGAAARLLHAEVRQNMWWLGDDLVPLTNLVGPVREVDTAALDRLLADNDALVVSPLAIGRRSDGAAGERVEGDDAKAAGRRAERVEGDDAKAAGRRAEPDEIARVNTDADRAAAAIAGAGGARRLVLAMDAEAFEVDGEPVSRATRAELPELARHARGGMAKKLRAVDRAFAGGVERVAIGRAPVPDLLAGRAGTLIAGSAVEGGAPPAAAGGRSDGG